jgi:hypothetical protein
MYSLDSRFAETTCATPKKENAKKVSVLFDRLSLNQYTMNRKVIPKKTSQVHSKVFLFFEIALDPPSSGFDIQLHSLSLSDPRQEVNLMEGLVANNSPDRNLRHPERGAGITYRRTLSIFAKRRQEPATLNIKKPPKANFFFTSSQPLHKLLYAAHRITHTLSAALLAPGQDLRIHAPYRSITGWLLWHWRGPVLGYLHAPCTQAIQAPRL